MEEFVEVFWRAFKSLNKKNRQLLALRILKEEELLDDLLDHFLIQKSRKEQGEDISLESYLKTQDKKVNRQGAGLGTPKNCPFCGYGTVSFKIVNEIVTDNGGNDHKDLIPSNFKSIEEAAEFWDTHNLEDYKDQIKEVQFEIELRHIPRYCSQFTNNQ